MRRPRGRTVYNACVPDGRDLIREWQDAMQAVASTARGAAGRAELPKALLAPMQRQVELMQELVDRERRLQSEVLGRLLEPVDAVFDLLEESGRTFRAQAEALAEASRALEQTNADAGPGRGLRARDPHDARAGQGRQGRRGRRAEASRGQAQAGTAPEAQATRLERLSPWRQRGAAAWARLARSG